MERALAVVGLLVLAVLLGFGLGRCSARTAHQLADTRAQLQASETLRAEEHHDAVDQITSLDQLATAELVRRPRVLAARGDLVRVQQSLHHIEAAAAVAPAASACGPDPRLAGLAQLLREGAELAEEGSRHVEQLRDQRGALAGAAGR